MALLDDIQTYLAAQGLVDGDSGWKCSIGFIATSKNQIVALEYEPGSGPDTHEDENRLPTFRVMVRASPKKTAACLVKWQAVYDALQDGHAALTATAGVDGTYHMMQTDSSAPAQWEDDANRPHMSSVFKVVMAT